MKQKTRGVSGRIPACPRCGRRNWRKQGLEPTNKQAAGKGWTGKGSKGYHQPCVDRLFKRVYICRKCKHKIHYGNAGRPIV